jgi:hypothetical protein
MKAKRAYNVKTLIPCYKIGQKEGTFIAIPDSYKDKMILVRHKDKIMVVSDWRKEAVEFIEFKDKFKADRKYTLAYFEWLPNAQTKLF